MLVRNIYETQDDKRSHEKMLFDESVTESVSLSRHTVKPGKGTQTALHMDREEFCVILKGRALLTVANELQEVRPGDAAYIPRNTRHQLACISDEDLEFLCFANHLK